MPTDLMPIKIINSKRDKYICKSATLKILDTETRKVVAKL